MGVGAQSGRHQRLAGRQPDPAVDLEAVTVLGDDHLGVLAASGEVLADAFFEFLGDARA